MNEDLHAKMLKWRHVEAMCPSCHGSGGKRYGHGSTWRGGVGPAGGGWDVCDTCWGSGDSARHWMDLRALEASEAQRIEEGAMNLLARAAGANWPTMRPAVLELAAEIERLSRGRKERAQWFVNACLGLVKTLREACK